MSRFEAMLERANGLTFEIEPCKKVGAIEFGMSRTVVRKLFDNKVTEFTKTKASGKVVDDFGGVHVYYDAKGKAEYVELFAGTATYNGVTIFPGKEANLIKTIGGDFKDNINVLSSIGYEADGGKLKSIGFGKPGYYSRHALKEDWLDEFDDGSGDDELRSQKVTIKVFGRRVECPVCGEHISPEKLAELEKRIKDDEAEIIEKIIAFVKRVYHKNMTKANVKALIVDELVNDRGYPIGLIFEREKWTSSGIGVEFGKEIKVLDADNFY